MEIGMNSITNYCRFIGTLVEDPELETLETTSVVTFTLAIHEYIKEKSSGGRKKKIVNYRVKEFQLFNKRVRQEVYNGS